MIFNKSLTSLEIFFRCCNSLIYLCYQLKLFKNNKEQNFILKEALCSQSENAMKHSPFQLIPPRSKT